MSFSVIYPQTAFTSIGANKVKPKALHAEVLAQPEITTVLDRIRVENPGSGSTPEVDDTTGRTWAFIFNGSGPLSGPETTALNAIVAAHTGIEAASPSTLQLGDGTVCTVGSVSVGQVFSRTGANAISGVAAGGGGGEANTSSNAGATGTGIALAKVGVDLPFAKIDGTNGIVESLSSDVLSIDGAALLPRDGSRAMTGALNMGGQAITSVGNVDGRDVSADGSALDAHIASDVRHLPASLGTALQQLRVNAGATAPEWFTASAGSGDVTAAAAFGSDNRLIRSDGVSKGVQGSSVTLSDTSDLSGLNDVTANGFLCGAFAELTAVGNYPLLSSAGSTSSDPFIACTKSSGGGFVAYKFGTTPNGNISVNPGSGATANAAVAFVEGSSANAGLWFNQGTTTNNGLWTKMDSPGLFYGFTLTYATTTTVTVSTGRLADLAGRVHVLDVSKTLDISVNQNINRLDTGTVAAATVYWVYLIRNDAGDYAVVASVSASAPTLTNANFTTTNYVTVARISHFRTKQAGATINPFYDSGLGTYKMRAHSQASNEWLALNAGTATARTAVTLLAGMRSATLYVSTNASATVTLYSDTDSANTSKYAQAVAVSQTDFTVYVMSLRDTGVMTYINSGASGSTTIRIGHYTYESYLPIMT